MGQKLYFPFYFKYNLGITMTKHHTRALLELAKQSKNEQFN